MDVKQLRDLYLNGWNLLNHTYDHVPLQAMYLKNQEEAINKGRDWLENNLFEKGKDAVVFPNGFYNTTTLDVLKRNNFIAGRSLDAIWNVKTGSFIPNVEICNLASSETIQNAQSCINQAIENKSTVLFIIHKLEKITDNFEMQFEPDNFDSIVRIIVEKKEVLNVLTFTEFMAGIS